VNNLISEVAHLNALAKAEASATYKQAGDEFGYECQVLNAAPALLDVLGEIRAGDAEEIAYAIQEMTRIFGHDVASETIEVLSRYQVIATKMEAERQ
jgi:hypothetical protein